MSAIEIAYLGVAGWHLKTHHSSLLVDPFFTRPSLFRVLFTPLNCDLESIRRSTPPADFILITHPHYDHIMDASAVARITAASIYGSPQGVALLKILEALPDSLYAIHPDDRFVLGDFSIQVFATPHRLIFGNIPYTGPLPPNLAPPLRASDFRMDFHFSFLVSSGNNRILVASGIRQEPAAEADILMVGPDATRSQLARILLATRPRFVLPNHWDDMFRPLSKPTRPMLIPPPGLIPSLRRIDLAAFAGMVNEILPNAQVIIPNLFEYYSPVD